MLGEQCGFESTALTSALHHSQGILLPTSPQDSVGHQDLVIAPH